MTEPVDKARWQRIAVLLDELLELPEAERPGRLVALCEHDDELRAEIEALLEVEGQTGLLDSPAGDYLATLIQEAEEKIKHDKAGVEPALTPGSGSTRSRPPEANDARFLPGTLLAGRYRIVNRLGGGGMGEVFRADDLKLGQAVALKFLSQELTGSEEVKARFLNEIKLARQIAHPNVCRVYDVGETDGQLFLSMEHVQGEDLASLLKRIGRLPREKATQIAQQLCAGLAAAHAEGILHRDLKPANVMLDERGRVRITDFGLAGFVGEFERAELIAGTPAYMSPEQLAGKGVSVQSDLYALGLLLYELFTGKRAFEGTSWQEVRRARESPPSTPSSHVSGIDPTVERVILRCLEEDPGERPSAALEVAATLPGGDPLAAALAAGETPSPEMVAAAGPEGRLRPGIVGLLLVVTLALLGIVAYLTPKSSVFGLVPPMKPVAVLVDDTREMLAGLGYDEPPTDLVYYISQDFDYTRFLAATDRSPSRWQPLAAPGQVALRFEYRQSPRPFEPLSWTGRVTADYPPAREGDISVITDLRGRLRAFSVVPAAVSLESPSPAFADWRPMFDAAGLEMSAFQPATPTRQPRAFSEVRAAWIGTLPELGLPVRIEAAAAGARPTFFECILPSSPNWTEPGSDEVPKTTTEAPGGLSWIILWLTFNWMIVVLPVILALRNLRLGRGDRRGASRLAAAVFTLRLLWWVFAGHHVPRLGYEISLLGNAVARCLFVAAVAWVLYVAIEPHTRRLWPGTLISWSRLLAGRVRDPLVGQHLLVGAVGGLFLVLPGHVLYFLIPQWLGWSDPPFPTSYPIWVFHTPTTDPLLGSRVAFAALASTMMGTLWLSLGFLSVLIALLVLVRRKWLAVPLFVLFIGAFAPPVLLGGKGLGVTLGLLMAALFSWLITRFGLLATVTGMFTMCVLVVFPVTLDPSVSYFGTSLFALAIVAGLAGFGAWTSLGRRPTAVREG
ncbi:MAG: protein kinase [bacterium]|nr:protein kinase [bacterium]